MEEQSGLSSFNQWNIATKSHLEHVSELNQEVVTQNEGSVKQEVEQFIQKKDELFSFKDAHPFPYLNQEYLAKQKHETLEEKKPNSLLSFWGKLSKLQKGLLIIGILLLITGLVLNFILIRKLFLQQPTINFTKQRQFFMPFSNQKITTTDYNITQTKLFGDDNILQGQLVTIAPTSRLLQQKQQGQKFGFLVHSNHTLGVTVKYLGPNNHIVEFDIEKLLLNFQIEHPEEAKNLLAQSQLLEESPNEEDQNKLIAEMLQQAFAQATDLDINRTGIKIEQTYKGKRTGNGFQLQTVKSQSSRLLYSLKNKRMLSWFKKHFLGALKKIVHTVVATVKKIVKTIQKVVKTVAKAVVKGFSFIMKYCNPIGPNIRRLTTEQGTQEQSTSQQSISYQAIQSALSCTDQGNYKVCPSQEWNNEHSPFKVSSHSTNDQTPIRAQTRFSVFTVSSFRRLIQCTIPILPILPTIPPLP